MTVFFSNLFVGRITNLAIALVSAILLIFNVSEVDVTGEKFDLSDYELIFEDEFDSGALNTDIWCSHNEEGIRKGGYWSMDQVAVSDGTLKITTCYNDNGKFGPGWYTAGISTRNSFCRTYGYYECRCILPRGQGLWSAFWLTCDGTSSVGNKGVDGSEIDVFESPFYFLPGESNRKVTTNIHYDGYGIKTRYKNVVVSALDNDPYENFNTYSVLWTENEYVFFINGYEVARTDYGGVSQVDEYMILSCEVEGADAVPTYGWSGIITKNAAGFSTDFIVDYVRVYQEK